MDSYADDGAPFTDASSAAQPFNPRLVKMRAAHAAELQDPNLRSFATRALLHEGPLNGLANNFEQLSNYANARGMGIRQALTSGFYGPVNNGTIQRGLSDDQAQAADAAIHSVFNLGRNKLAYRIDQGTVGDPNYNQEVSNPSLRPAKIDGNFFSDHPSVGQGWAKQQLAADMAYAKEGGTIADRQYEDGNPAAAITSSIHTPSGRGALSMASTDDDEEDTPALAKANGSGALFKPEAPNKLIGLGSMLSNVAASLASITNPAQAKALREQAQGFDQQMAGNFQYMMGPNGQLVRIDKNSGNVTSAGIPGASSGNFIPLIDKNTGRIYGTLNKDNGKPTYFNGGDSATAMNGAFGVPMTDDNPHGLPDDIETLRSSGKAGEALAKQIEGTYTGDLPYPSGGGRMNREQQRLKDALSFYYPDMNANDFNARKKFRESVADAKGNGRGAQYASLNHSYDLMAQVADNVERLQNSDNILPVGLQQGYNLLKNQQNTKDRSGAAKNIDSALIPSLMGETSKLYYGTQGGGQEERKTISKSVLSNDTLTNQIEGLKTIRDQAVARQHVLEGEADKSYGKGAEKYYPVDKAGQASLDRLNATIARLEAKRDGTAKAAPAAKQPAAPTNGGGKPPLASFFQ